MQDKLIAFFTKLEPKLDKLANNLWIKGLSNGMMATLPFTVLGSFTLLLQVVPFEPLNKLVDSLGIDPILSMATSYSIGMVSILMVIFITKNIVQLHLENDDGISAAVAALFAFLIVTPGGALESGGSGIPTQWLGASGAFSALIISFITSKIYVEFKTRGFTIKMPEGVPPMVANVFEGITPTIAIGVLFIIVSYLFSLTSYGSMHETVYALLQAPLQKLGGSLGTLLIVSLLANLLWFFGIHGQNVLMPFIQPLWMALDLQNLQAISNGGEATNIVGYAFYSLINFGGYQLALIFLLMRSKSKQMNQVGKLTLGPALFGIGEPLNFGLPLVMNFKFLVPFMTNSLIMLTFSYFMIKIGFIPHFNGSAHIFGLPIGVGAFLQAGWRGVLLQFLTQGLAVFLWLPWFKMAEKEALALENQELAEEQ